MSLIDQIGPGLIRDAFRILPQQVQEVLVLAASLDLDEDWLIEMSLRPLDKYTVLLCIRLQHRLLERGAEWVNFGDATTQNWKCVLSSSPEATWPDVPSLFDALEATKELTA